MKHEIKCMDDCGTVLGSVDLAEGQTYKGDRAYGMRCDKCTEKENSKTETDE